MDPNDPYKEIHFRQSGDGVLRWQEFNVNRADGRLNAGAGGFVRNGRDSDPGSIAAVAGCRQRVDLAASGK